MTGFGYQKLRNLHRCPGEKKNIQKYLLREFSFDDAKSQLSRSIPHLTVKAADSGILRDYNLLDLLGEETFHSLFLCQLSFHHPPPPIFALFPINIFIVNVWKRTGFEKMLTENLLLKGLVVMIA